MKGKNKLKKTSNVRIEENKERVEDTPKKTKSNPNKSKPAKSKPAKKPKG